MANITPATVLSLTDKVAAEYLSALGTDASTYGLGASGASSRAYKKASDLVDLVIALADADQIVRLLGGAQTTMLNTDAQLAMGPVLKPFLEALKDTCRAAVSSIRTLDDFATYYNLLSTNNDTAWQCLFAPDFATAYLAGVGVWPTAYNTYFEVLQGSTYTNGLRKLIVGGAQTAGQDIDDTKYAGGFGQIKWSGGTGSGVVTVTGKWRKTDGTTMTGDGTATLTGASGTAVLTPPATDALLLAVTGIAAAAEVTAGTIYAEATRPAGRTNPPT